MEGKKTKFKYREWLQSLDGAAEQAGFKAYPYNIAYTNNEEEYDGNFCNREPYKEGFISGAEWILKQNVSLKYLIDWYIASVNEKDEPKWTEEHLKELLNDFVIIPQTK